MSAGVQDTAASVAAFRDLFSQTPASDRSPLEASSLTVQFGGLRALDDVTFALERNETMSIVGQNGAGKSTLLNAISGLVPSSPASRLSVNGMELAGRPAWRRARAGIGRAFQDPPLVDEMSVRDNILVGAHARFETGQLDRIFRPRRVHREEDAERQRADVLLELTGLSERADERAGSLPYGSRKLLDITRALMGRPVVLLLDEPTSGLDALEQKVVESLLSVIHEAQCLTILVVEHHMELVRTISDRVLVLNAGAVESIDTPDVALNLSENTLQLLGEPAEVLQAERVGRDS